MPSEGEQCDVAGFRVTVESVVDQRILRVLLTAPAALPGYARRDES